MCERIDFHDPKHFIEDLKKYYDWDISDYIRYERAAKGYNIPPSSDILIWYEHHHKPEIELMHWVLIPFWAKDPPPINAIKLRDVFILSTRKRKALPPLYRTKVSVPKKFKFLT